MIFFLVGLLVVLIFATSQAPANEWTRDVDVTQLKAYQETTHHFFGLYSYRRNAEPSENSFDNAKSKVKSSMRY